MNINEITKELKEKYPEMEITVAEDLIKSSKRKTYASELTKEDLQKLGVVDVDFDNLSEPFIDAHTPYGILCKNYGVCESYSEAFALIGRIAGLQVVMESGDLQGGPHEWNRVCVDGSWCVVDVTNNDSDFANPLLNVSEKQIEGVLIPDGYSYLDTYEALDETKEYYYLT